MGVADYHPKLAPAPNMALKIFQLVSRNDFTILNHPHPASQMAELFLLM